MYWNSIVFTGKMLNSFNEHESFLLKSNSYKEYHRTAAPWHLLSEFRSRNVNCTMTLSSFRSWHVIPWSSGLLAGRRALRHCSYERTQNLPPSLHWLLQRASLEGLCSALLSLPQPQTEWCASFFQQQIPWSSPRCASPTAELPLAEERFIWPSFVWLTYKSAAEYESETHSRRTRLPCGPQSNAEKSLFWQDSHLLPSEGQGSMVGCL